MGLQDGGGCEETASSSSRGAFQSNTDYAKKTKGNTGHGLGPPDGWTFGGLLFASSQGASPEDQTTINAWLAAHPQVSKAIQHAVCFCRISKTVSE